MDRVPLDFK